MATSPVSRVTMQLQEYFDQLAPTWDKELTPERLQCLGNIVKESDIKPGDCVLDIGSGTGVLLPFLITAVGDEGRIMAFDFSAEMLIQAQTKNFPPTVGLVQADVVAIPLPDNSADLAICNSAFPHFGDKVKALAEIARVIKNGGRLVICHTMSRKMINQLHQSIGGIVARALLPDEFQLRVLIKQARLKVTYFEDNPERYLVIAEKSTR
jgi:ubiquinone/menaquinone biosynthesis C-methylase UbiE